MQRKIIHLDMDAFFASVEQRDFPELRGQPVVVGGNPHSRGVVAAASYEARKFGIRSAMPTRQAYERCKHAVFVKPRFKIYQRVSRHIMSILRDQTPLVEPLSLDEAFMDVTAITQGKRYASALAKQTRQRIFDETGLTASAGVAPNKFLAKIASDLNKPNGMAIIRPEDVEEYLKKLEIRKVPGVGKVTSQKMAEIGVQYIADLQSFSEEALRKQFGKQGAWFFLIARGIDERSVKPDRVRKSISCESTFSEDISDLEEVERKIDSLSEELEARMKKRELAGRTFTLKVTYSDFEKITRSTTSTKLLKRAKDFRELAMKLTKQTELGERPARLLGIGVSKLEQPDQLELF